MPDLKPYIILGLALGGVFALSAVGTVVLFRATAVLNLAAGAIGATGSLVAWTLIDGGVASGIAYVAAVAVGAVLTVAFGVLLGPALAARDPLEKAITTLGLMLVLLGGMALAWSSTSRSLLLPTTNWAWSVSGVRVNGTEMVAVGLAFAVTVLASVFLKRTDVGTAMRAMADDREASAILGIRVRKVEAVAWLASGVLSGVSGLLLASLVGLDATTMTFLVIPALAAALVGRLESLWLTFFAALAIGVVQSGLTPVSSLSEYRTMTPFVFAIVAVMVLAWRRPVRVRV